MAEKVDEDKVTFDQMELDDRVLKAIAKLSWTSPTIIQEKAIPLFLEGKDVLLRARTGSGKTAAFAIPVIQKVLNSKASATQQQTSALILAPSKELCRQIHSVFEALTIKCQKIVQSIDLSYYTSVTTQKLLLSKHPDVVISTPGKILAQLQSGNINLKNSLETLVIDEADLVFSFGFENDLKGIVDHLPSIYQAILASATLSDDVSSLKQIFLHNPVVLKLEEPELAPSSQLSHYHISAEENDKAAILYALFKLHLIRGKSIIFVNTVDRCYKLKLFLEQFSIKSCVLNSELPSKIRCHAVNQFNQGIYDIIIASDEHVLDQPEKSNKFTRKAKGDAESGVARGIDFQCVSNVINFDFPLDINSYIHRAGRTARGNNTGSVLSFVDLKERDLMNQVEEHLQSGYLTDDAVMKNYQFKLEEVEPFRYRAKDAWRAITRIAIRDARLKEIKVQIFNCEKLKSYFENNPRDLQVLRHDKTLGTIKKQAHLSDVPDYIIPDTLKRMAGISTMKKSKRPYQSDSKSKSIYAAKRNNPLLCAELDYGKKKKH
ncbi:probable ATP-dependent RNA helicase DDX56 [Bradysia coprophila]|uniref:probable ATP-dependent RNA helicase DDX56 n=1 Tax=Bradysia coprophila TaxID=38358 RepID=UPI00187D9787|nr:probable ATP-dependent RNA helicase DDX56 [Bradysia coprophila]XP_037041608.1 probable ATP-dependent RNA helicase DDX56 [Bradysia coprophila]XP_037041609.1 probable ATP-dependent RNA helicase DDX56 [Bradysia coprophila]